MKKRLQLAINDESRQIVEALLQEANDNFDVGSITFSDVVNEMIVNSKVDVKQLQAKHTDVRRSLMKMAGNAEIDLDAAIKALVDLKAKTQGRKAMRSPTSAVEG